MYLYILHITIFIRYTHLQSKIQLVLIKVNKLSMYNMYLHLLLYDCEYLPVIIHNFQNTLAILYSTLFYSEMENGKSF